MRRAMMVGVVGMSLMAGAAMASLGRDPAAARPPIGSGSGPIRP